MNKNISSLQCAYDYLVECGGERTFAEIWSHVVETLEMENPENRISAFYTNLTLDGRFVTLGDNLWDLRERNTSDKVLKLDPKVLYGDSTADVHDEDIDEDSDENSDFDESNFEDEDEEENSEEENY
jgi:DNA-directed RNA polymerase subunit delta